MSSLNPDPRAIADILAYDDTTAEFFREELASLPRPRVTDSASLSTLASSTTARSTGSSLYFLRRFTSRVSIADSVVLDPRRNFTLRELCDFIAAHKSLQTAVIVTCSCYTVPMAFVRIPHRFLIIQLRRHGRKDVWMRLDRRPSVGPSALLGVTPSNDSAILASSLGDLLPPNASHENQIAFIEPCLLATLRLTLLDLTVVMDKYKLNSENCWVFCSLLQKDLLKDDEARLEKGELRHASLAQNASQRLSRHRQAASILSPHDPSQYVPLSTLIKLFKMPLVDKYWRQKVGPTVELARRWENLANTSSPEGQRLAAKVLSLSGLYIEEPFYQEYYYGPQLTFQLTALCRQVILGAGEAWAEIDQQTSNSCVHLLCQHGEWYLKSTPRNNHEALLLFEEATSVLVPQVTRNWQVCILHYYHAVTLYNLNRVDDARGVVVDFIECTRHNGRIHNWRYMEDFHARGIWPSEYNYLIERRHGDLPEWEYWRQEQV